MKYSSSAAIQFGSTLRSRICILCIIKTLSGGENHTDLQNQVHIGVASQILRRRLIGWLQKMLMFIV